MLSIDRLIERKKDGWEYFVTLSKDAIDFIESQKWCEKVSNVWYVKGWEGILCVYMIELEPTENSDADNKVYAVVGDIPSVYVDIESASNSFEVLECYVSIVRDWTDSVANGNYGNNCYPINIEPSKENIEALNKRLDFIEESLL